MQEERQELEEKQNNEQDPRLHKKQKVKPVKPKSQPKQKTAPAKPRSQPKQKTAPAKPKRKAKKGVSAGGIISVLLIIVIVGLFVIVYFNIGGAKQKVASLLDIETSTVDQTAQTDDALENINIQQEELDEQLRSQNIDSKDLESKAVELDSREQELIDKEEALNGAEVIAAKEKAELDATALIFELMDAKLAATAISGLAATDEMAKILLNMISEKAAAILDQIESSLATKILSEMISE